MENSTIRIWRNASWAILAAVLVATPLGCGGGGGKTPNNTGGSGGEETGGSSGGGKGGGSPGGSGGSSSTGGSGGSSSTGGSTGSQADAAAEDDGGAKAPKELGATCSKNCPDGLTCDTTKYRGMCTKTCTSDSDCAAFNGICNAGQCYKTCAVEADCKRQGWLCASTGGKMFCDMDPTFDADAGATEKDDGGKGDGGTKGDGGKGDGGKKTD